MKTIKTAMVLHCGWEMDNEAWVKEDVMGRLHLFNTSHGSEREMTVEELDLKIEQAQRSIDELNALRELVI